MTNITILPYKKELLKNFKYNGTEKELSGQDINPIVEWYAKLGVVYVALVDDRAIGVGGGYPLWGAAVSFFMFLNTEAKKYKVEIFKGILNCMKEVVNRYEAKSIYLNCVKGNIKADSLISHLGFKQDKEIIMRSYVRSK